MRPRRSARPASADRAGSKPGIRSAARMLWVFHQLIRTPKGRQLAEISRELSLPEVTVLRVLQTLVYEGFVRKDPERGRYRLSPMFWLAAVSAFPDVREVQHHFLQTLRGLVQQTGAAATLAVPYVGLRRMGMAASILPEGAPAGLLPAAPNIPMHALAAGKCYLASLAEGVLQEWLRGELPRVTDHTLTEPEALLRELARVRACGYATDREECQLGAASLAVPVVDSTGTMAAALQLSCRVSVLTEERLRHWLPRLQSAARAFSQAFSALAQLGGP